MELEKVVHFSVYSEKAAELELAKLGLFALLKDCQ